MASRRDPDAVLHWNVSIKDIWAIDAQGVPPHAGTGEGAAFAGESESCGKIWLLWEDAGFSTPLTH